MYLPLSHPTRPAAGRSAGLDQQGPERALELLLRVGVAMCFVGHGAFGIITKEGWLPYFALFGIPADAAYQLMPLVGAVDILMGVAALVAPCRLVLVYTGVWALWTALLRPLAGESIWETLERAGNYGVPLAFLLAAATAGTGWTTRLRVGTLGADRRQAVLRVLQWTTGLLLIGHGAFGALERKPLLAQHWAAVGLPSGTVAAAGALEIALGVLILARPGAGLFLCAAAWKVATELLYPIAGAPVWEFVERGGSYVAPLAAWVLIATERRRARLHTPRVPAVALALALVAGGATGAAAQEAPAGLVDRLRGGGYVLACRHAITETDQPGERTLSDEGRKQARQLGAALRRLRIPVGRVAASPRLRTLESARLSFRDVEATPALFADSVDATLQALFAGPVPARTNRVLVTHQGVIREMLPRYGREPLEEGDCLVLRPTGAPRPEIVARVPTEGWRRLRR